MINGEAIYDTHNWITYGEGEPGALQVRFTVKGNALYAVLVGKWPGSSVLITSLAQGRAPAGKITSVTLLGAPGSLPFTQEERGLRVTLPAIAPGDVAYALKITGLKMNPPTGTASGNPMPPNALPSRAK